MKFSPPADSAQDRQEPPLERVLLVEDNLGDSFLVEKLLRRCRGRNFEVTSVIRLESALECLAQNSYRLVLLDLSLPDSQREETFHALHGRFPEVPVLVLSGNGDETAAPELLEAGAYGYLDKANLDYHTLYTAVVTCLKRREAEDHLRRLKQKADRESEAKSNFLGAMSHELRTPLSAILGFTEILLSEELSEEHRKYLDRVDRNARHLLRLVNDLLDHHRVQVGELKIQKRSFQPQKLLVDTFCSLEGEAHRKGVRLEWDLDASIPGQVETDPLRLKQILINVISNAVKFSNAGTVSVSAWMREGALRFLIRDEGEGVPDFMVRELFKPYSKTQKPGVAGVGLSLYLSRRLAQALGGDVRLLETEVGRGSVFEVSVQAEPSSPREREAKPVAPAPERPLEGMRLLLVEDNEDSRVLGAHILRCGGAEVKAAETGQEALKYMDQEEFDGVLMDVQLPDTDGLTVVKKLRARGLQLPIFALSAHAFAEKHGEATAAGCTGYLTKPVNFSSLLNQLAEHRNGRRY